MNYFIDKTKYILTARLDGDYVSLDFDDVFRISLDDLVYAGFDEKDIERLSKLSFSLEVTKDIIKKKDCIEEDKVIKLRIKYEGIELKRGINLEFLVAKYFKDNYESFDNTKKKFALNFLQQNIMAAHMVERFTKTNDISSNAYNEAFNTRIREPIGFKHK